MARGAEAVDGGGMDRAALVQQYLPLVQHAVSSISPRVPRHVAWEDLISAGMLGLAEAARSFDPARGVPFEGFATQRIRGALLDELRSLDWASRSVRTKARLMEERSNALAAQLGRTPTPVEVADHLGVDHNEVQRIVEDVHRATLVHYDAVGLGSDPEDILPAGGPAPDETLMARERLGYLRSAVSALPERLRIVVEGYFFHERLMQDIADELGVTESRVSQMRSEALALLRDGMNSQLDPEMLPEQKPESTVGRRRAAYYAAVAAGSDFRSRLDIADELGVTESRVSQMRSEALALLRDGMNSQLDPEMLPEQKPESTVGRRRAAYYAAVAAGSDFRSRLDIVESQAPAAVEPPAEIRRIGLAAG